MKTVIDTSKVPANLVIGNETEEVKSLPLFGDNGTFELNPGEQIIYKVETAREYVYYYKACKDIGLALAEEDVEP